MNEVRSAAAADRLRSLRGYAGATAAVAAAALLAEALRLRMPPASLALLFVCAVLVVALGTGRRVALYAAVLSSLLFNFLFTEPRFTLEIRDAADLAAFATLTLVALIVGQLASRQREQLIEVRSAHERIVALQEMAGRLDEMRREAETERLRTALLSSVSHDLRSPLTAVIGAASSLAAYGETLSAADRRQLVDAIRSEGERLDRYIRNLLDMTRLGSGPLKLERDWIGLDEIVAAAKRRLEHAAPAAAVEVELEPGLPPVFVHAALIEQALYNVLENAASFSPAGAPIRLRARRAGDRLEIDVVDRGPGIPAAERERIFELFRTGGRPDGAALAAGGGRGGGLGLTIVRGMIGAHGGTVEALPGDGGAGTTIRLRLPLVEPPRVADEASEDPVAATEARP